MSVVEQSSLHVPKPRLFAMVVAALVVASIIVVCFVLPAEYRVDPTGIGQATGVIRLAGPKQLTASDAQAPPDAVGATGTAVRYYDAGYRSTSSTFRWHPATPGVTAPSSNTKCT
jgi:hypothetical protein